MKYFLDTEFVATGDRVIPVSVGIVMDGLQNIPSKWQQWIEDYQWPKASVYERATISSSVIITKPHHALHDAWELYHKYKMLMNLRGLK